MPSVHWVSTALPDALVVTVTDEPDVAPFDTCAPAVTALNVTTTPGTGEPAASVMCTAGWIDTALPAAAVWLLPAEMIIDVGWPTVSVNRNVALVRPGTSKLSPCGPGLLVAVSVVNVAAPDAFVAAVTEPLSTLPLLMAVAVTVVPPCATALPPTSAICTTGCGDSAAPLCAVAPGCVVKINLFAAPVTICTVPDVKVA